MYTAAYGSSYPPGHDYTEDDEVEETEVSEIETTSVSGHEDLHTVEKEQPVRYPIGRCFCCRRPMMVPRPINTRIYMMLRVMITYIAAI